LPEGGRDDAIECGQVFGQAFRTAGARDYGGHGRVGQRELQGGSLDADAMAGGNRLDALDLGDDLG